MSNRNITHTVGKLYTSRLTEKKNSITIQNNSLIDSFSNFMTASNGSINSDISFDEVLYIPHSAQLVF